MRCEKKQLASQPPKRLGGNQLRSSKLTAEDVYEHICTWFTNWRVKYEWDWWGQIEKRIKKTCIKNMQRGSATAQTRRPLYNGTSRRSVWDAAKNAGRSGGALTLRLNDGLRPCALRPGQKGPVHKHHMSLAVFNAGSSPPGYGGLESPAPLCSVIWPCSALCG